MSVDIDANPDLLLLIQMKLRNAHRTSNKPNIFKRRLDAYWQDQNIIYDFVLNYKKTISRSEVFRYE